MNTKLRVLSLIVLCSIATNGVIFAGDDKKKEEKEELLKKRQDQKQNLLDQLKTLGENRDSLDKEDPKYNENLEIFRKQEEKLNHDLDDMNKRLEEVNPTPSKFDFFLKGGKYNPINLFKNGGFKTKLGLTTAGGIAGLGVVALVATKTKAGSRVTKSVAGFLGYKFEEEDQDQEKSCDDCGEVTEVTAE